MTPSLVTSSIGREHLVSIQDIGRQYNVQGVQRHHQDLQSVDIWVEEMRGEPYNPILLYKTQNKVLMLIILPKMIYCSVFKLNFKKTKKFGNNVDSTHGTTMYDFLLITLMVLDEFDEGIPIAWAISNREDQSILIEFFKSVRATVGNLNPKFFMSDCADQFFNAWISKLDLTS